MPQLEAMGDTAQLAFALYFNALALSGCNEFIACEALSKKALEVAERVGDLKAKSYAMNGVLHASVFLARDTLETLERIGAECVALSTRLGDSTALNYTYWNIATDCAFRGLMREAREWALRLLNTGGERNDRRALGIAHSIFALVDSVASGWLCAKHAAFAAGLLLGFLWHRRGQRNEYVNLGLPGAVALFRKHPQCVSLQSAFLVIVRTAPDLLYCPG